MALFVRWLYKDKSHCRLSQPLIRRKKQSYSNIWSNFAITAHITSELKINNNHSDGIVRCMITLGQGHELDISGEQTSKLETSLSLFMEA